MGGHRVPGTLRAGASAEPGAVRLPAASSNPASHHPAHPRRQTPRDGITTLCLPWGRAHAGWLLPTTHHQGGGSRAGPPNPCQPPPQSTPALLRVPCRELQQPVPRALRRAPALRRSWETARKCEERRFSSPRQCGGADVPLCPPGYNHTAGTACPSSLRAPSGKAAHADREGGRGVSEIGGRRLQSSSQVKGPSEIPTKTCAGPGTIKGTERTARNGCSSHGQHNTNNILFHTA